MRNYVIINGVNSLTIQGLAINILPSITKAPIRTINETIDGRDGDITTFLGYGAYDKTIEIGLFGNFNVDKVIQYFNTKGTIVFSDENDKVYNFEINDQIDFAKLIKFRTATINIHCQPFKYPLTETPIEQSVEYVNASGTDLTLNNTDEMPFAQFDLKGNTSQSGTPTPTNPIDVDVVSGDNTIKIIGENILPQDKYVASTSVNGIIYTNNGDGTFDLSGTASANTTFQIIPANIIDLEANQPYYLYSSKAYDNATFNMSIAITENGTSKWIIANNTLTPTAKPTNVRLQFYIASGKQVSATNVKLMLVKGTTPPSTYKSYQSQSIPITLGNLELCKIGNYQDYIHKINGGWAIHKATSKIVLNGTEDWQTRGGGTSYAYALADVFDGSQAQGLCDHFYFYSKGATNSQTTECIASANTDQRLSLFTNNSSMSSVDNLKTWLSNNNVSVYYSLTTPIEEAIEDADLIAQLDALERANSYDTKTYVSQSNNDLPFILNVDAMKKGSNSATITNGGNIYSKPIIDLIGTGNVGVYLNGVQMFEVDLSEENEIVINTEEMEAYNPSTLALANRKVIGDYSQFKLDAGANTLSFSGKLTKATISKYSRWL